ncbi:MAG: NAD-dependent epimerase/dehydratase family protein [Thermoplasmata archaeon]|nr:NAD-dependent epimerase/dehydratase family protein [Thermoplasmata archaeon]
MKISWVKNLRYEGKKVLVTGSNGFVGRSLVQALKAEGAKVIEFDISNGQDITDWKAMENLEKADIVFHLAAIAFVPYAWDNPQKTYNVNVLGTLNILEYCRKNDIEKMVLASSYIYGPPEYLPVDEKHPLNPNNPYSRSKLLSENLCKAYHDDFGLKCLILRPQNIYGKGQDEMFLIPEIIKQLPSGKITLKDPNPKRDFIYLDDVIEAYLLSGLAEVEYEAINIGSGKSYSVREIVDKIIELHGKPVDVSYSNETRKNEVMDVIADIRKAKDVLGWEPKHDLEKGLSEIYDQREYSHSK